VRHEKFQERRTRKSVLSPELDTPLRLGIKTQRCPERGGAIHPPCRPAGSRELAEAAKARASAARDFIRPSRSPAGADRNRNGLARRGGGLVMPEQFPSRQDEHHGQGCEQDRKEKASHRHSPEVFFLKICFEPKLIAAPLRLLLRGRSGMPEERREDRFVPGVNLAD
jgi:hypothetical protein